MKNNSSIALRLTGKKRDIGGFEVRRIIPVAECRAVGSFVFLDHMGPAMLKVGEGMDVLPHPHIGLATVTYLYDGSIMHRDSLGSVQEICPGDVNLMTAGQGIVHSERSSEEARKTERAVNGLQMWVALPKEHEETAPAFNHTPESGLPAISGDGWQGRLVAGSLFGETSPVKTLSRYFFADIRCAADGCVQFAPDYDEAALYVVEGEIEVDGELVEAGTCAVLRKNPAVTLTARENSIIAVLGGDTMPEPRFIYWNFVSTSRERIDQAKADWKAQRFAKVPGEDSFTPLPD